METRDFIVETPDSFAPVIACVLMTKKIEEKEVSATFAEGGVGAVGVANVALTDAPALITLTGDLGAGKTTFTQQLAKHLGITEPVVSPTFGIMKLYPLLEHPDYDQLVHIDAYRIEDISEAGPLRLEELFQQPRTLICLEWPENIAAILPPERIDIAIEITAGEQRKVMVSKVGA